MEKVVALMLVSAVFKTISLVCALSGGDGEDGDGQSGTEQKDSDAKGKDD